MGISGLNPEIKSRTNAACVNVPIGMLEQRRVAIDGNFFITAKYKAAFARVLARTDINVTVFEQELVSSEEVREEFVAGILDTLRELVVARVLPVVVFDGAPPPEKHLALDERREKRDKLNQEIERLVAAQCDGLPEANANQLRVKLKEASPFSRQDMELGRITVRESGLPWLQATGEGEQLCSMLAIEGKVAAVWSSDTDALTYGCPLLITGFGKEYGLWRGEPVKTLVCWRLDKALEGLAMSYPCFVDFCIMLQCDYNKRIRGVGPKTAHRLLSEHKSIDSLPAKYRNDEGLNAEVCRRMFSYVHSSLLVSDGTPDLAPQSGGTLSEQAQSVHAGGIREGCMPGVTLCISR